MENRYNKYAPLFQPIKIGKVEIKNRFLLSPMSTQYIDDNWIEERNAVEYFATRAKGGTGLIMTGCRYAEMEVEHHARNMPCLTYRPDLYVRRIKEITDAVHSYGAKMFYQIGAGMGRNNLPQDDRRFNVAASVTTNYFDPTVVHRELTNDEVYKLIRSFGKAAKVAKDGGADGIEVHSIHGGYLLDSFTMASYNHRTDEFGGDAKARALFPILLMQEVKKQCGDDFPVSIRFAVKSFIRGSHLSALPGHPFKELGRDCDESLELAQILDEAGYDCFNVDCGSYDGDFWGKPPAYMPAGPYLPYSKMVKDIVHVPVMVSGKLGDPDVALKAVMDGDTDMVALGRPLLADPDLVNKVKRGDIDDIRRCLTCNEGCLNRMATQNRKSSCAINPCANREEFTHLHPTTTPKKILVVGAGPTGMEAARVLSTRGHKVTVVERDDVIGGRFRFAAVPSFKREDRQLIDWYGRQLEKLDVDLRLNYELKFEDKLIDDSDVIITATGANSIVPKLPGINYAVNALDLLAGKEKVGRECTVIGGGLVGLEVTMWLGSQGVKCRLIEMAPKLCYSAPPAKQSMQMIEEYLREYKVDIHLSTKLCEVTDHSVIVENSEGTRVEYETEKAVLAIGFFSKNTLYKELLKTNKEVYNIGDSRLSSNVANGIFDAYELGQHLY